MTGSIARTPFGKVLVANRGEIAARIIRSARSAGLATVAVYSTADAGAAHAAMADEAVCIGPPAPSRSYLSIDAIIEAARATGAGAIHPGYGFLAENATFAAACAAAGMVFVGPSADAIRAMGDKARAKALMAEAGLPCLPGYGGASQDPESLAAEAERIGWPVMVKAAAGGGGRGMRLVVSPRDFAAAVAGARSEAATAFGDDRLLLEKAIPDPRHVEIQILADRHGNAVHLGERDCSIQRRHQKLVEESPSPALTPDLREAMGAAAIRAALAIGYEGAGTLEFLLDGDGGWFFMEMNARLQVEHPVTESVTGIDLVAAQLRIAAGEPLGLAQRDIVLAGHAIEVRLCAEDPHAAFAPQSGNVAVWRPPASVRVDHALAPGSAVPAQYDSLLAKLVARGPDRESARAALMGALGETVLLGVRTNAAFLRACLSHPLFASGEATTGFVEATRTALLAGDSAAEARAATLAAALSRAAPGIALTHGFAAPLRLRRDDRTYDLDVATLPFGRCRVAAAGDAAPREIDVLDAPGPDCRFREEGIDRTATLWRDGDRLWIHAEGRAWDFEDVSLAAGEAEKRDGDGCLRAAMTGRVVSVDAAVGDPVEPGAVLLVIEAMKMEHAHRSDIAGTVTAIHVAAGEQVEARRVLIEIAPA